MARRPGIGGRLADSSAGSYARRLRQWLAEQTRGSRERYAKLEPRERRLVQIGALLLLIFLAYNLIYLPTVSLEAGLADAISSRQHDLAGVRRMTQSYRALAAEVSRLEKHTAVAGPDFALSSVLATALGSAVGNDKIGGINSEPPKRISAQFSQFSVDLTLKAVSLKQLVDALYRIKTLKVPVVVSSLDIKRRIGETDSYDVDMVCLALARNG